MNHHERQLRAGIAVLMAPAESLGARQAQINNMAMLLNVGVVSVLLSIINDTRRDAINVLSFVVEQTSPDNPAWAKAAEHAQHLFELVQEAGMSCEDEGCPHYGTPHSHVEHPAPMPEPAPTAQLEPIPPRVYYDGVAYRFREAGTTKDMGYDFYRRWQARALEFPIAPKAPVNPASQREIQPGMRGFNAGDKREGS